MSEKKIHFNFKFIKFDVSLKALTLFVAGLLIFSYVALSTSFSINTSIFSCNVKPVKIETEKIKVGTSQREGKKK